jgi:N-acetyl-gamma-glutamyl-phosphate reductase
VHSHRIRVAVLGASGFAGAELLRLLHGHPAADAVFLGARDVAGQRVGALYPHLAPYGDRIFEPNDALDATLVDAVFLALPAGESSRLVPGLAEVGCRVVDIGADFRLPAEDYQAWYGFEHTEPAWLAKAAYGLTELFRDQIAGATVVANPGCYPTPVVLGLAPLLREGLVEDRVVVDGKSGISGAGKKLTWDAHFAALDGTVRAYKVGRHQHTPEMERALALATGSAPSVTFVPHLVPTVRGIVTTSYAAAKADVGTLRDALSRAYREEPFVRVLEAGQTPDPKRLAGTNVCELSADVDEHSGTAVVIGAIDNLGKGAAGQAVQNLNVLFGLDETTGLSTIGVYP